MGSTLHQLGIEGLSVAERLELIGLIWDSIIVVEPEYPVLEWHLRELERRRADADTDPIAGIPCEVVKARLSEPS